MTEKHNFYKVFNVSDSNKVIKLLSVEIDKFMKQTNIN